MSIASLNTNLDKLKYLSLFYFYSPANAIKYGQVDHSGIIAMSILVVISTILAIVIFQKRDISL